MGLVFFPFFAERRGVKSVHSSKRMDMTSPLCKEINLGRGGKNDGKNDPKKKDGGFGASGAVDETKPLFFSAVKEVFKLPSPFFPPQLTFFRSSLSLQPYWAKKRPF